MFDNVKKFARKHKYKFIIAGISIALVGVFLAWFVNLVFLAMIFLSFIWTGYIYSLGTKHPLDKNKTSDSQSKVSKDIKLENDLKSTEPQPQKRENVIINENNNVQESQKFPEYQVQTQENIIIKGNNNIQGSQRFPEYQVQTQETKNLISNKKNKNMDQKVKNQVSITEELVKSYIDDVFVTKQKSDKSDIEHPNLVDTTKKDPADGVAAGPELRRLLHRHFQKVNWWEYQLSEILSQVKQIVSILTNKKLDEICTSLSQYKNNDKLSWFVISFEYAIGKWPTGEDATHSPDYLRIGELAYLIDEISTSYQEKYPQIVKEPSETGHKYDNVQGSPIDSHDLLITEKSVYSKVFQYLGYKNYTDISSIYPVNSHADGMAFPIIAIVKIHLQDIQLHKYSLDQIISYVINIIGILTGTEVSNIKQYLDEYRRCDNMEDKKKVNRELTVTEDIEKVIGEFSCTLGEASYKIDIEHLDKLIKEIEERYQVEINKLKEPSPKLENPSQLSK